MTENELSSVKQELKDARKELHSRIEENEAKLQQLQAQFEDNMKVLMLSSLVDQFPMDYASMKTGILLIKSLVLNVKRNNVKVGTLRLFIPVNVDTRCACI